MASSYTHDLQFTTKNGMESAVLTLVVTAHTDGTVDNITTDDMTYMSQTVTDVLTGFNMIRVITEPGTGGDQPTAYTLDIFDQKAIDLSMTTGNVVDLAARSTTLRETEIVSNTSGYWWPVKSNIILAVGDLGASNKCTIELHFKQD